MNLDNLPIRKPTSLFRECLGIFGAFAWFFCSMYSYEETLFGSYFYIPAFLFALFLSMLCFGLYFRRDVRKLSRFAAVLTPLGIVCTAVMYLLPLPGFVALYIASGAFMGPMLLRRVYGAVTLGGEGRRFRCYFQGVALTVVFHSVWAILPISHAIKFPVIALLAGIGWFGILRALPEPEYVELPARPREVEIKQIALVALAAILWYFVNLFFSFIHTYFVTSGFESDTTLWFGGTILPAIGFFLFAYLFDKQYERLALLFGMGFALLGLILALIPSGSLLVEPLLFTDGLGSVFTEFIIVAASVYMYRNSRRAIYMASAGLSLMVLACGEGWLGGGARLLELMGLNFDELDNTDPNLVLSILGPAAVVTLAFIALCLYLMDKRKETNIVFALFKQFSPGAESPGSGSAPLSPSSSSASPTPAEPVGGAMLEAGLTQAERDIALMLMEGETQREIARKLHMTAADVSGALASIKDKVSGKGESDPVLAAIVKKYRLTRRESDILGCLRRRMSNPEIAADLFLSEETVKIHVRNLMKKLPVETRAEVAEWAGRFGEEGVRSM